MVLVKVGETATTIQVNGTTEYTNNTQNDDTTYDLSVSSDGDVNGSSTVRIDTDMGATYNGNVNSSGGDSIDTLHTFQSLGDGSWEIRISCTLNPDDGNTEQWSNNIQFRRNGTVLEEQGGGSGTQTYTSDWYGFGQSDTIDCRWYDDENSFNDDYYSATYKVDMRYTPNITTSVSVNGTTES